MNKFIVNALSKYNFTYGKNSGYGFINDYEVNVLNDITAPGPTFVFSTFLSQDKKNDFVLKMNAKKIPLVQTTSFEFGVIVIIGAWFAKSFEKKFAEVIPVIVDLLETLEAPKKDTCPQSGEIIDEENSKTPVLPGTDLKIRLSNSAIQTINSSIDKSNEDFENAPNNYLKGFGGILIGALAGVSLTVIFSLIGFITALAPLVSIFLGVFLYKKFGGKQNYTMIIMSLVTTLLIILGALILMYITVATKAVAEAGMTYRGFEALIYCINNVPEFKSSFILDISLNGLFILLAEGFSIYRLITMIRRPQNLQ